MPDVDADTLAVLHAAAADFVRETGNLYAMVAVLRVQQEHPDASDHLGHDEARRIFDQVLAAGGPMDDETIAEISRLLDREWDGKGPASYRSR